MATTEDADLTHVITMVRPATSRQEKRVLGITGSTLEDITTMTARPPMGRDVVLALDLGLHCGWALGCAMEHARSDNLTLDIMGSGTWELAPTKQRRFEGGGMRWLRLRRHLEELDGLYSLSRVVVEEVRAHKGTAAAHAYGGALATVTTWCESLEFALPYEAIPVATIKRHATGKGNANKAKMIAAAEARGWTPGDDNEADALWLLDYAVRG